MSNVLRIDFESRSRMPLSGKQSVGVYNYANHESTEILMLGYKLPDAKGVDLWQPRLEPMPKELVEALNDPNVMISAFNSTFERYLLKFKLGMDIPISRFIDPQASARYLSLPADLDSVSEILGLPKELAKDKRGEALIKLFCEPHKKRKKRGQEAEEYWNDWTTHPKEWEEFCEYCKQDIRAEEEVSRREQMLGALPLPPLERRIWEFDQRVNDRGVPVDVEFVIKALKLAERSKKEALDSQNKITGLENSNSRNQLLAWARERGYPLGTLRKESVDSVLNDPEIKLTDECRQVLKAKKEAGSTSYRKLNAIIRQICPDNKIRGMFIYMGSSRCGRWSGNAVQLHNVARPDKIFEDMDNLRAGREMILAEDYDGIKQRFGSVLLTIKYCLRTAFVANETKPNVGIQIPNLSIDEDDE